MVFSSTSASTSAQPIPTFDAIPARVAFVQSCWHREIVDRCRDAFRDEIARRAPTGIDIDFFEVTGAFEIPLQAKLLARSGRYAAVVAAGLVVDGGIYRHEFVAQAVISALMQVQLDTEVPVISAVLTPHHFHTHADHTSFFLEHFVAKGIEAATACNHTVAQLQHLRSRGLLPLPQGEVACSQAS